MHIRHILQLGALVVGSFAVGCASTGGITNSMTGGVSNAGGTSSGAGGATAGDTNQGGDGSTVGGNSATNNTTAAAGNSPTGGSSNSGNTATGGAGNTATGGAGNTTTGGSNPTGGSSSGNTGGTVTDGGADATGGSDATGGTDGAGGSTADACVSDPNQLINEEGWNCVLDSTTQMQGSVYPYGDGSSCPFGPDSPSTNICSADGCCLSGTTTISDDTTNYANWGCGIGMELNSSGGDDPVKSAYAGPVECFDITISGSSGGNDVRVGFPQQASPPSGEVSPFVLIGALTDGYTGRICFKDAECPTWKDVQCTKTGDNGTPYDLQIQISAGSTSASVGAYNICVTSIIPVIDAGSAGTTNSCSTVSGSGTITDPGGSARVKCNEKEYIVQNNVWGSSSASQTITYGQGTKFKVTQQTGSNSGDAPVSYPSLFIGANSGRSTASSGLPLAVSSITTTGIKTAWTWASNGASGSYNAAYDVWFSTSSAGDSGSTPSGGYLMVWYHKPSSDTPIGTSGPSVTLAGKNWIVWSGNNSGNNKPCVSYVAQSDIASLSFNLGEFIRDAVDNKRWGSGVTATGWYLTNVFSGFEIWSGGVGLETTDFAVAVP